MTEQKGGNLNIFTGLKGLAERASGRRKSIIVQPPTEVSSQSAEPKVAPAPGTPEYDAETRRLFEKGLYY